ncbi:glycosyl hydrolase family 28 protein [Candidatus Poribacteria bacterium]
MLSFPIYQVFMIITSIFTIAGKSESVPEVMTYDAPPDMECAPDFKVKVNGEDVFVYDSPVAPYATFSFSGNISVEVTAIPGVVFGEEQTYTTWGKTIKAKALKEDIEEVDIRPKRLDLKSSLNGNTISFDLDRPCNLSVEINKNLTRPLFLFANPLEKDAPVPDAEGIRYFEGGKIHHVGTISLKDNETVYIAGGAVVRGSINGENVKNARVIARGILDGSDENEVKSPMISMRNCENIEIEGLIILNNRGWTVVPNQCQNISFINMKQIAWNNNSDGIDICGCQGVTIDGCFLRNNDDCIPIKANRRNENNDVSDVKILNSVFWNASGGNALEIGFELRTNFVKNIFWKNCDIIHVENGAVFSVHNGDRATVENIKFEDIWIEDAQDELIDLCIGLSIYSEDAPWEYSRGNPERKRVPDELKAQPNTNNAGVWLRLSREEMDKRTDNRGRIRNIHFKNIHVTGDHFPTSIIQGYDDQHPVESIKVEGLWIHDKQILNPEDGHFHIEMAKNVEFIEVK